MKFSRTAIPDVLLIEPRVFEDSRGFFFEVYRRDEFSKNGVPAEFVQDNHSRSSKGTLRGLHFQKAPMAQAKLVRVTAGSAYDVAVDLRPGSPTFGKFVADTLSASNRKMLFIPEGFAHGFLALEDGTEMFYKVTRPYSPADERGVLWSDPALAIPWPKTGDISISEKDGRFPGLKEALKA